jgi:hypothetical protein
LAVLAEDGGEVLLGRRPKLLTAKDAKVREER